MAEEKAEKVLSPEGASLGPESDLLTSSAKGKIVAKVKRNGTKIELKNNAAAKQNRGSKHAIKFAGCIFTVLVFYALLSLLIYISKNTGT